MKGFAVALCVTGASALVAPSRAMRAASKLSAEPLEVTSGKSSMDPAVLARYMSLPTGDSVQCEYVWLDATRTARSKCRTLPSKRAGGPAEQLPRWTYDGSSTGQAPGSDSEVIMVPRAKYMDPFRGGDNILVLCDCYAPQDDGTLVALPTNSRAPAVDRFVAGNAEETIPWYGIEQEYTLFNLDGLTPLGWPVGGFPKPQGPYYCGAGADRSFGRAVCDAHYAACLFAGLDISGTNAEVMPGQWEYQIGPTIGIAAADQLVMSRFILDRVCEDFGVIASLEPKPIKSADWNGAGAHINFSTEGTRKAGGIDLIFKMCEALGTKHAEHIAAYGEGNAERLTGACETASIDTFKYGVADRGASIRIPRDTGFEKCGYLEDRRPASNVDVYLATSLIFETTAKAHLD